MIKVKKKKEESVYLFLLTQDESALSMTINPINNKQKEPENQKTESKQRKGP